MECDADHAEQDGSVFINKEVAMTENLINNQLRTPEVLAILALADIKAAAEAFDSGEMNVINALDAIVAAVEAWQAAGRLRLSAA